MQVETGYYRLGGNDIGDAVEEETGQPEPSTKDRDRDPKPIPALQQLIKNERLALTGDPGSGKSTFVNHLAYSLAAHQLAPDVGWLAQLKTWPDNMAGLLPFVVILRDFAGTLPMDLSGEATPHDLWTFIANQLEKQNLEFAADAIHQVLEEGHALLLLDGLDEVPTVAARIFVRDAVMAFVKRYPGNRFLVTCRILSYLRPDDDEEPDLRLDTDDFPIYEISPFDEAKIDRFIAAWYAELARIGSVPSQDAQRLAGRLKEAVRRQDL